MNKSRALASIACTSKVEQDVNEAIKFARRVGDPRAVFNVAVATYNIPLLEEFTRVYVAPVWAEVAECHINNRDFHQATKIIDALKKHGWVPEVYDLMLRYVIGALESGDGREALQAIDKIDGGVGICQKTEVWIRLYGFSGNRMYLENALEWIQYCPEDLTTRLKKLLIQESAKHFVGRARDLVVKLKLTPYDRSFAYAEIYSAKKEECDHTQALAYLPTPAEVLYKIAKASLRQLDINALASKIQKTRPAPENARIAVWVAEISGREHDLDTARAWALQCIGNSEQCLYMAQIAVISKKLEDLEKAAELAQRCNAESAIDCLMAVIGAARQILEKK